MSTVEFDAPQSIGDDFLPDQEPDDEATGDETESDSDETIQDDDETSEADSETVATHAQEPALDEPATEFTESDDLLAQIWNAERECRQREANVELLKEQIKEAKALLEQAVIALRQVCSNPGSQRSSAPARSRTQTAAVVAAPSVGTETPPGPEGKSETEAEPDQSWRDVPLTELFAEPIKGIGQKKKEALIELCPTIGAFEDLRARVGKDAATLSELLPDRLGPDAASELEERVLDWLKTRNQASEESPESQVLKRAKEINDGSTNCLDTKHPEGQQWHSSGWSAFGRQIPLIECPYIPGPEQDDWIRGWLAREVVEKYDSLTESIDDAEPDEQHPQVDRAVTLMDL